VTAVPVRPGETDPIAVIAVIEAIGTIVARARR
jgi:hypothetical protein